ncbi:4-hydroxybenzoate polyprenyl transferase [Auriscalpium vulgare]|uniref:4-hydroxybenzoate polyprenyl transferase n=1 Tax=Auriscalpium vulgare TaxID=40419 RepID=A0ACB8S992_9AGAM|nr:4-hydroxybenzoate polyprenyl transferase [Auriscalpium vulgare]
MSAPHDGDDFEPTNAVGYKPTAVKSLDEYQNLDAGDESLARWKASLGISNAPAGDTSKPKLTVLSLELTSPSLPPGKTIKVDIQNQAQLAELKNKPIQVKEGAEYQVYINFTINHSIVTGARYLQVVKRSGIRVEKVDAMLGSYGVQAEPRHVSVVQDDFPSGMLARGVYNVKSRVTDFDGGIFAEWDWLFKIGKDCWLRNGGDRTFMPLIRLLRSSHNRGLLPRRPPRTLSWPCHSPVRHTRPNTTTAHIPPDHPGIPSPSQFPSTPKSWVDRMPAKVQPYLYLIRIDKPIGTLLLYYPCTWSITMAAYALNTPASVPLTYLGLFGVGALVMRGAGCTINDLWDRNLDKAVERTKTRPLARGDITPRQAVAFLVPQMSAGLAVLTQLNWYSILLGASSLSVVTIYPLMKRITHWPQAVLGLAFNWGALLGWSAVAGAVNWAVAAPLYAGGILWTLVYDSIYAHQDKHDDRTVGIRSTALLFGERTRPILYAFSASSVGFLTLAGYMNAQGAPFYLGVGLAAAQLARVVHGTDFNNRESCARGFVGCGWAGFWVWMAALGDYAYLRLSDENETDRN